jgi:hypothetical protein
MRSSIRRSVVMVVSTALLAGILVLRVPAWSPVSAVAPWAPASSATIHPGVQLVTDGSQCTGNFIFTESAHVYIGQAAHCARRSGSAGVTLRQGCASPSLPIGTPVQITGASRRGRIVYSSWLSMDALHETDPDTCLYNDFALVEVDPADTGSVNPSVPIWGGPEGIAHGGTSAGDPIYGYGHSGLGMGLSMLNSKQGVTLRDSGDGWSHSVLSLSPGIPGDSGSAYLDSHGRALGTLSTLDVAPVPGTNDLGDLGHELAYVHTHTSLTGVQLALGTETFGTNLQRSVRR